MKYWMVQVLGPDAFSGDYDAITGAVEAGLYTSPQRAKAAAEKQLKLGEDETVDWESDGWGNHFAETPGPTYAIVREMKVKDNTDEN